MRKSKFGQDMCFMDKANIPKRNISGERKHLGQFTVTQLADDHNRVFTILTRHDRTCRGGNFV